MSRLNPKAQLAIILTALACIPLIYASLLVWSVKDPTGSLETMTAAIVNEDSPATTDDGEELTVGDDLTEELLDSDDSFSWETMTESEAHAALEDGDVRAILTIPEDFSTAAASLGDDDPLKAATSQLTITTDDASNIIAGNIAATVGEAVRSAISQEVGEAFLAQVTVGFTDIAESLSEAADGAHEVADGASSAHAGAGDLVVGLDTLADGAYDLSDGAGQLAAGTAEASQGATQLADGLQELDDTTAALPDTARTIDEQANSLADGIRGLAENIANAAAEVTNVVTGLDDILSDAQNLSGDATELVDTVTTLTDGTDDVATNSQALLDDWDALSEEQRQAAVQELANTAADAHENVSSLHDGAQSLADDASALVGSSAANGASTGLTALAEDGHDLQSLLDSVHEGAERADEGSQLMYEGADRLTAATGTLVEGADELSGAIGTAASASGDLSEGLATLSEGADELNAGTDQLVTGTNDATAGAGDLQNGLGELDDGSTELATGLDEGRDEVPTYTDEEGDHLASTASDPVELEEQRAHEVAGYGWGLAPYFMSLALWVGSMGYFLMRPALNLRRIVGSSSTIRAVLASIMPAVLMSLVQSSLMVTLVRFGVGIDMANTAGVYALSFFTSLTFFLLNQFLVAALGPPGRFFALVLIVLQLSAAGGTYPIETAPPFLQRLHGWLPLTHSVDGLRSLVAGGPFDTAWVLLPIAAWCIISLLGLVAVVLVVSRKARRDRSGAHADDDTTPQDAEHQAQPEAAKTAKHAG